MNTAIFKTLSGAAFILFTCVACNNTPTNTKERTIEVTGSAEQEIEPDQVYFKITLQEYKKLGKKVSMKELETQLIKKAQSVGVKKEDVKMENAVSNGGYYDYYYYDYYYYYGHSKRRDYFASKTFTLKFDKPESIEKFLASGDSLNYTAAQISRFDNSKKQEYRDSLKMHALKAAKHKAEMLLSGLDEKVGQVLSIIEVETPQRKNTPNYGSNYSPYYRYWRGYDSWGGYDNLSEVEETQISNQTIEKNGLGQQQGMTAPFKDLKLRYEIKAVFSIKENQ